MYRKKIFLSTIVVLIFLLLNIDLWQVGNSPEVFRDPDEAWYGIVIKHISTDGCQGVPVSYNFQDRINFHSCQFLAGLDQIFPFSNVVTQSLVIKFLTRTAVISVLGIFSWLLLGDLIIGALLGLVLFLDDGIYVFKPAAISFLKLWQGQLDDFSRLNRFISPMQYQLPLLVWTLLFCYWLFSKTRKPWQADAILFISTIFWGGIVVLTPFYAWASYFITVFWMLIFGWFKIPKIRRGLALGSFSITVLFSFALSLSKTTIPYVNEVFPRSGFFNHQWSPLFLMDKGLIFGMFLLGIGIYQISRRKLLSIFVPISFYMLVNINLLTGKEFQNFHFRDYLGPLWFTSLIFIIYFLRPTKKYLIYGILIFLSSVGLMQHLRSQLGRPSFMRAEMARVDSSEIISFFKGQSRAQVYCGDFYQILPLMTSAKCSWHHLLMTYPLSNQELLHQSMSQWRLSGLSDNKVEEWISVDASLTRSLGVWSHGVLNEWIDGKSETEMYSCKNLLENIIPKWMAEYKRFTVPMAIKELRDVEFFVLPIKFANENTNFEAQAIFSEYGIYKIKK